MVKKRDLIIAVLIAFCLTTMLFLVKPIGSQTSGQYDPWLDINDDGKIDIRDVHAVAVAYGSSGDSINKTALLYNVNDTFTSLLSEINTLNATITELQNNNTELQDRVTSLEEQANSVKTIRFYQPNETIGQGDWIDAATFVWTPRNSTNNVILEVYLYYQGKAVPPSNGYVKLLINDTQYYLTTSISNPDYELIMYSFSGVDPNQDAYSIRLQIAEFVVVKDINIILQVIDGLSPS